MKTWLISDLHFSHVNMIKHARQKFSTIQEMNDTIISNWNKLVSKEDLVYILGDIKLNKESLFDYLPKLNGKKILIKGNHDYLKPNEYSLFESVHDYYEFRYKEKKIILSHYPIYEWNNKYHGSFHFYGHLHNTKDCVLPLFENSMCVNLEFHDFKPLLIDEAIKLTSLVRRAKRDGKALKDLLNER